MREKVVFCWSGGKDSARALYEAQRSGAFEILALVTTLTEGYDRISMHGVRRTLLEQQTDSLGLHLHEVFISPQASNEEYETKMGKVLTALKREGAFSVLFGDIFLEDLRAYREKNLSKLQMKGIFPIWKRDTFDLMRTFIDLGFRAITTCVDPKVLAKDFVGREIDRRFLTDLPPGIDPCGENGEFHSFVFDGPLFKKRIPFVRGEIVQRDSFWFCDLIPEASAVKQETP